MPNQTAQPAARQLYTGAHVIDGNFVVGAVGAVGAIDMPGVYSITRNSAGKYTIVLQDNWVKLKNWAANMLSVTGMDVYCQLSAETVASDKTIVLQWYANGGVVATDPPAGKMYLMFKVTDSSIA
jgi:hypothetical protein